MHNCWSYLQQFLLTATQTPMWIILWRAKQLEKTTHNEDWFRINVYGDLYDNLFNLQENWTTKRSECHSLAWKRIKELRGKNIKLDFILAFGSNNGLDEIFFTEDKSSNKNPSKKEQRKSDFVRVKMLDYWSTVLPYKECLNYLECCSSHFNGLKLQIMCTKIYNDITIHYLKREVHVPNNSNNNSSLSVCLVTVLSLMRTIQINLKKAQAMLEIYEIDTISFLPLGPSTSVEYESDSQSSSQSLGWEEEETKRRILEKIQIKMKEIEESDREKFTEIVWEILAY